MASGTLTVDIIWYTCPVCESEYDIDYWEGRTTCVCCGAPCSENKEKLNDNQ